MWSKSTSDYCRDTVAQGVIPSLVTSDLSHHLWSRYHSNGETGQYVHVCPVSVGFKVPLHMWSGYQSNGETAHWVTICAVSANYEGLDHMWSR